jgi:hypothetical protein
VKFSLIIILAALLLQGPTTVLESLWIIGRHNNNHDVKKFHIILSAGLLRTTKLKRIDIHLHTLIEVVEDDTSFDKLLCDTSSIESIYSSNHT